MAKPVAGDVVVEQFVVLYVAARIASGKLTEAKAKVRQLFA